MSEADINLGNVLGISKHMSFVSAAIKANLCGVFVFPVNFHLQQPLNANEVDLSKYSFWICLSIIPNLLDQLLLDRISKN